MNKLFLFEQQNLRKIYNLIIIIAERELFVVLWSECSSRSMRISRGSLSIIRQSSLSSQKAEQTPEESFQRFVCLSSLKNAIVNK
jgi:hypothetical protein